MTRKSWNSLPDAALHASSTSLGSASLQQIIQDRTILSIRRLRSLRPSVATNDSRRIDRHIDYICCSIQWPNVYVLDRYLQKFPRHAVGRAVSPHGSSWTANDEVLAGQRRY